MVMEVRDALEVRLTARCDPAVAQLVSSCACSVTLLTCRGSCTRADCLGKMLTLRLRMPSGSATATEGSSGGDGGSDVASGSGRVLMCAAWRGAGPMNDACHSKLPGYQSDR